jgi:PII-like signaling protein
MGYGTGCNLNSDKFLEINYKSPVVVEIIDEEEKKEITL